MQFVLFQLVFTQLLFINVQSNSNSSHTTTSSGGSSNDTTNTASADPTIIESDYAIAYFSSSIDGFVKVINGLSQIFCCL